MTTTVVARAGGAAPAAAHPAIAAIAEQVREAYAAGDTLRIVAGGRWLDAGRPVDGTSARCDVSTARGILEYVPGDLTLTALAGTPLSELHAATAEHGQRVTLDPYGTDAGTLGATVATASAGPLSGAYGTPRDLVLGVAFVTGTGAIVRGGGRVVKNVAGFDLVRLATGAWGTLGAIAEVTLRLRARPAARETLVLAIDADDDAAVRRALAAVRGLPFTFDAAELLDAGTATALEVARTGALVVDATGAPDMVRAMRTSLAVAGDVRAADPELWPRLRVLEGDGSATIRLSHAPARAPGVWRAARQFAETTGGRTHMAVGRSVARVAVTRRAGEGDGAFASRLAGALSALRAAFDGTCTPERMPAAAWAALPQPPAGDVRGRLARGVRDAFDPARLLNPGILGPEAGRP